MSSLIAKISDPIEKAAEQYGQIIYSALAPGALKIFTAFVVLWALHTIVVKGILEGDIKLADTLKKLCLFSFIVVLLRNQSLLWDLLFNPLRDFVKAMVQTILHSGVSGQDFGGSHDGYVGVIDNMIQQVAVLGKNAESWNPVTAFGGTIIMLLYTFVAAIAIAFVLEYIYVIFLISAFSPILLVALGFDSTRRNALNAVQSILCGALTILFSIIGMSLTMVAYRGLFNDIAPNGDPSNSSFAWGADWLAMVMLALVSILQQLRSKTLASNLTGISDGAGMAASVAGLATAAVMLPIKTGGAVLASFGKSKAKSAWETMKAKRGIS